jgi:hypothetical protein
MAARQMRWVLLVELLIYSALGWFLVSRAGWTPLHASGLALAGFLGLRLFIVAVTFGLMLKHSSAVPDGLRIGLVQAVAVDELAGLCQARLTLLLSLSLAVQLPVALAFTLALNLTLAALLCLAGCFDSRGSLFFLDLMPLLAGTRLCLLGLLLRYQARFQQLLS